MPEGAARAARSGGPDRTPSSATLRRLEDGSIALVLRPADAPLAHDAVRTGAPLLLSVTSPASAAHEELARGLALLADGPLGEAYASLTLARSLAPDAPHDAGAAHLIRTASLAAADAAWAAGDPDACLDAIRAADAVPPPPAGGDGAAHPSPPPPDRAGDSLASHLAGLRALLELRPADAVGPLRRVVEAQRHGSPVALHRASVAALLLGDVEVSADLGRRALAAARAEGRDDVATQVLEYLAYAEMRCGRHSRACAHATEGLDLALRASQANSAAHHRAVLAFAASVEGDGDAVRGHAEAALATARRNGLAQTRTLAEWALARDDLGRGRADAAASRLTSLAREGRAGGHFAIRPLLLPDLVEAVVLAGRPEPAVPAVEAFAAWADFGVDAQATAQAFRCRALLAAAGVGVPGEAGRGPRQVPHPDEDDAGELFLRALDLHQDDPGELERSRTRFLYGRWLRRRRRLRAAREQLRVALHGFERCGAAGWADLARGELRAAGEEVAPGGRPAALTPHQLRIARAVATGATNREIAQQLAVSVRTVDHHLRGIFVALGVRSRVDVARMVHRDVDAVPSPHQTD
ncbi:regulatory LuxR family protein [Myceligenerans xiligouense]|uniref:Regulatory LuxR family protein n=2 Tax=Myceligenerans xiligouense TaxID=253184 RepID=A0A3N4YLT0_9MICO|nr:regulatory LuxR family protein [Myceligenerans xiligouense]